MRRLVAVGLLAALFGCSSPERQAIPDPMWRTEVPAVTTFSGGFAASDGVVVTRYGAETVDDDGATIVGRLERLGGFDLATGALLWTVDLPEGTEQDGPMLAAGGALLWIERVTTDEPFVHDTRLVATDLRSGEERWSLPGLGDIFHRLVELDGIVVVTSTVQADFEVRTTAVDLATGSEVPAPPWVAPAELQDALALEVADGVLVVSRADGTRTIAPDGTSLVTTPFARAGGAFVDGGDVVALDLTTGEERWRVTADRLGGDLAPVEPVSAVAEGGLAVLSSGGLVVLDAATGEELGRAALDPGRLPSIGHVRFTGERAYYVEREGGEIFSSAESALVAVRRDGTPVFRVAGPGGFEASGVADEIYLATDDDELVALP